MYFGLWFAYKQFSEMVFPWLLTNFYAIGLIDHVVSFLFVDYMSHSATRALSARLRVHWQNRRLYRGGGA